MDNMTLASKEEVRKTIIELISIANLHDERDDAIMHVIKTTENDLRKQQVNGFYRDIELSPAMDNVDNQLKAKERELEGIRKEKNNDKSIFDKWDKEA